MLDLHHQGFSQRQISQDTRVSVGYVNNVVKFYEINSSLAVLRKTPLRNKLTDVVECVQSKKFCKPSVYTAEIQPCLLLDGISPPGLVPSQSAIKKCIREDCKMAKKKVSQLPTESLSQTHTEYTDNFLDQVGQRDYTKLHFFDESIVIGTTGNRVYDNFYIREPAIEFQCYASTQIIHSVYFIRYTKWITLTYREALPMAWNF